MAVAVSPAPGLSFAPAPRSFAALPGAQSGGAGLLGYAAAGVAQAPADIWYGSRVGIVSCREQRYVAAFPRGAGQAGAGDRFDLEVSGFHPFRGNDATDRLAECPSEWVILQFSSRQHRGPVRLGDEVCFAKELATGRRDRYAFLALGPAPDGSTMEPTIVRGEGGDLCRWTLVPADERAGADTVRIGAPLLIRGKYNDCLGLGPPLRDRVGDGVFRSPSRLSGRGLACSGRSSRAPELHFAVVKAGVPCIAGDLVAMPSSPPAGPRAEPDGGLAGLPRQEQEQALLEDVLLCLLGAEGAFVRPAPGRLGEGVPGGLPEVRFEVQAPPGADSSSVQLMGQLLPLCGHRAGVQRFVDAQSRCEFGTVNHAFCAALRDLLQEFSIKLGQLESALWSGNLTIAKLWYHLQPSMDTFAVLHRIVARVFGHTGGSVLNGIEEVMVRSSLTSAQDLCEFLLQQASRPYFDMISKWIYEGRLDDPYYEFFVSETPRVRDEKFGGPAADFWQKHFLLEERAVPQLLGQSKDRILNAGKYLHVFASAAPDKKLPEAPSRGQLKYSRRRRDYTEAIDAAYRRASSALLELFMRPSPEGLDLPGRLRSMRSFFFLGKADWFGHLLDTAAEELEQPAAEVALSRLEGLLDLAVRASSAANDAYRDDISCAMHSFRIEDACHRMTRGSALPSDDADAGAADPVAGRLTPPGASPHAGPAGVAAGLSVAGEGSGIRCVTLKYRTSWPLSIVFSRALLLKYQVIFRHLLYCRYVERKLVEVWVDHQYTKELGLETSFSPSYSLRQRMLHFCRDYIYYITVEVLEPHSHRFLASLEQADSVDEVLKSHEAYLDGCLRETLLTERESLYRHLSKVLQTCLTFAYNLHRFSSNFHGQPAEDPDGKTEQAGQSQSLAERRMQRVTQSTQTYLALLSQKHYSKMISKFKVIFESQLQGFLQQIHKESTTRYEPFLSNLATRLDYNEYYSSILAGAARNQADGDNWRTASTGSLH